MYTIYDTASYLLQPSRRMAQIFRSSLRKNPFAMDLGAGRFAEGLADMFLRTSRYVKKPEFNIDSVKIGEQSVPVYQTTVLKKDFANLVKFKKAGVEN